MIVVRLKGRLGNQMFQYAAGRALALRLGVDLALDNRVYDDRGPCALDVFNIVTVEPPRDRLPSREKTLLRRALAYRRGMLRTRRELEVAGRRIFTPWLLGAQDWTYLQGYFQDDRYFADHAETIRRELTPREPPNATASMWLAQIEAEPFAVSVHVRRGDFVGSQDEHQAGYYRAAMLRLASRNATFFIFSDDPEWCRRELQADNIVTGNAPHDDLRLMAACRDHVRTPGSSFSWWGGWLQGGESTAGEPHTVRGYLKRERSHSRWS